MPVVIFNTRYPFIAIVVPITVDDGIMLSELLDFFGECGKTPMLMFMTLSAESITEALG